MAKTLITFPGKTGDALAQWPCAYQWYKQTGQHFDVMIDERIKQLEPLFGSQECVDSVIVVNRIKNVRCGGQPWDMNLSDEEKEWWPQVFHMGLRDFPTKPLTLQAAENIPITVDIETLSEQSLFVGPRETRSLLLVHGTTWAHIDPVNFIPRVWDVLAHFREHIKAKFDEVVVFGDVETANMCGEYGWPYRSLSFVQLYELMNQASYVIGSGSMGVVLAACLGIPSMRIHDPLWGSENYRNWSNIGPKHINYFPGGAILVSDMWEILEDTCLSPSAASLTA